MVGARFFKLAQRKAGDYVAQSDQYVCKRYRKHIVVRMIPHLRTVVNKTRRTEKTRRLRKIARRTQNNACFF
jgi:hypothetical protein